MKREMWPEITERLMLHAEVFAKKKKWLVPKFPVWPKFLPSKRRSSQFNYEILSD